VAPISMFARNELGIEATERAAVAPGDAAGVQLDAAPANR
jgi:hypothetical protein